MIQFWGAFYVIDDTASGEMPTRSGEMPAKGGKKQLFWKL